MGLLDSKVSGLQSITEELQSKEQKLDEREAALEQKTENLDKKDDDKKSSTFNDPFVSMFDLLFPPIIFSEPAPVENKFKAKKIE